MELRQDRGTLTSVILSTVDKGGFERVVSHDAEWLAQQDVLDLTPPEGERYTRLVMIFTYPDDSGKLIVHSEDWVEKTRRLILRESAMIEEQLATFKPDTDWRKNHAVIRELQDGTWHTVCLRAGHGGDDQQY
jgi:hypothetical protein